MTSIIKWMFLSTALFLLFCMSVAVISGDVDESRSNISTVSKVDKIVKAKSIVKSKLNYPDTLSFHDMKTSVSGNTVSLTFTASNGFGVPSTQTMKVNVND